MRAVVAPSGRAGIRSNGRAAIEGADNLCNECCGGGGVDLCCGLPGPCGVADFPLTITITSTRTLTTSNRTCAGACILVACNPDPALRRAIDSGYPGRSITATETEQINGCSDIVSADNENDSGMGSCTRGTTNRLRPSVNARVGVTFPEWSPPTPGPLEIIATNFSGPTTPPPGTAFATTHFSPTRWGNGFDCGNPNDPDSFFGSGWTYSATVDVRGGLYIAKLRFTGLAPFADFVNFSGSINVGLTGNGECASGVHVSASLTMTKRIDCPVVPGYIPDFIVMTEELDVSMSPIGTCRGNSISVRPKVMLTSDGTDGISEYEEGIVTGATPALRLSGACGGCGQSRVRLPSASEVLRVARSRVA